jgi:molecular chaperone HscB
VVRRLPDSRYFELFGITPALNLDLKDLEQRYFRFSRQCHPDLFARKSAAEQQTALDKTALLNDAYRTLRDPIRRAEYFVGSDDKPVSPPPELLEEVFELNMAIEEGERAELETYSNRFSDMLAAADAELSAAESPEAIRAILNRRKYIKNLVRDVQKALHA